MTTTIAITGKSGSGKTTITKGFLNLLKEYYPDAKCVISKENNHCAILYENKIYDATGIRTDVDNFKITNRNKKWLDFEKKEIGYRFVGVGFHPDPQKRCILFYGRGWNLAPTDYVIKLSHKQQFI